MDDLHDPAILSLPHPIRVDAAAGEPVDTLLFEKLGIMPALRPYLTDAHAMTEWIINKVPGMREIALYYFGVAGNANMGSFLLNLVRARLRAHGDPLLQVAPALQAMLAETDLAEDLPAGYFRSPYTLVYIELARPNALQVTNRLSGLHVCEGAYVGIYELPPGHEVFALTARNQALKLNPGQSVRVAEIVIIGSPIGKAHALDDASQDLLLLIQDEEECLEALVERHLDWFNNPASCTHPAMRPMTVEEIALVRPVVFMLAKVLLYLNLPDAEKRRVTERSDLEQRLPGLGPKKAAKLGRKLASTYNRILIGPSTWAQPTASGVPGNAAEEDERHVRTHWRRGHFRRIRYGEKLAESRLGWIPPVLVNARELAVNSAVKTKPYVVR